MRLASSCLLAALVVTGSRGAVAQTPTPPIVHVFVAGSPEAVSGMRDALQDQCARPNLAVMVQDAASADAALLDTSRNGGLADAYVDLRPDNETRVVVVDGQTHAQLEGRTLGPASSLEMSIEMVAQVVCSAIDSTLAARAVPAAPLGVPAPLPASPPAKAPPLPAVAEVTPRTQERASAAWAGVFGIGADYGAGLHGGGGGIVGANLGSSQLRFGGAVLIDGFPSLGIERQGAEASLDLYGLRLLPTIEWHVDPQLSLFAGVGGGADWIRVSAGNPPAGAVPRNDTSSVEPMLSSLLGAKFSVGLHVAAWLAFGADLDLARHRYVNEVSGEPVSFFEPPRARPVGIAGLAVSFDSQVTSTARGASTPSEGAR